MQKALQQAIMKATQSDRKNDHETRPKSLPFPPYSSY